MAPLKRKRVEQEPPEATVTRRATRQTSIPPLPAQPDPEPRRRRPRAISPDEAAQANGVGDKKASNGASAPAIRVPKTMKQTAATAEPTKTTRSTRHSADDGGSLPNGIENQRPGPVNSSAIPPPTTQRPPMKRTGPPKKPLQSHQQTVGVTKPITIATSGPAIQPQQHDTNGTSSPQKPNSRPDRNIDKVVLGNICFRAWYPSYYGKEVLGDVASSNAKTPVNGGSHDDGGAKQACRRDRDHQPMLDRLYVCPCCFKYSKELVAWWEHVRVCEQRGFVPGRKIYVHPKPKRIPQETPVPIPIPRPFKKKKPDPPPPVIPKSIQQDVGEWSIWEVDGEKDVVRILWFL